MTIDELFDLAALLATEEQTPNHLHARDLVALASLLTPASLIELCQGSSSASARMVRSGSLVLPSPSSRAWVEEGLRAGATLIVDDVSRCVPRLAALADAFADRLGYPVHVNAYLTPPGSRGNDVHFDTHDVLVLQLHGHKRWSLWPAIPELLPVRSQRRVLERAGLGESTTLDLAAGDILYIPRGVPHEAHTIEAASLHLSVGLHPPLVRDALLVLVELLALEEPALRRRERGEPEALARYWCALAADPERLGALARVATAITGRRRANDR